jgi:hypothetical protein
MKTSTRMLSSSHNSTASLILPLKSSILGQLDEHGSTEKELDPVVHMCKMTMKHDLEERYVATVTSFFLECNSKVDFITHSD